MSGCDVKGCFRTATHHLEARAWAMGFPKSTPPLTLVIGLRFCKRCARDEARSKNLITEQMFEQINAALRGMGRIPADRASVELVALPGDPADKFKAWKVGN